MGERLGPLRWRARGVDIKLVAAGSGRTVFGRRMLRRLVLLLVVLLLVLPIGCVGAYRLVPPPVTILMLERAAQGGGIDKAWRGLGDISPALARSVIAAEDAGFCGHHGFDLAAMEKAAAHNARSERVRGGSTISQQTAKNVFLWPERSYVRKGIEAYFTALIEALWGKRRILEVYLNVVEWGPGLYGAEAASQRYFHKPARSLTPAEAARLAAVLPSPLKWRVVGPGRYVAGRTRRIGANARIVKAEDLAGCVGL